MKGGGFTGFSAIALVVMLFTTVMSVGGANGQDTDLVGSPVLIAHNGRSAGFVWQPPETGPCWYVTESGYIAAVEEDLLDRAIFWAGMGDAEEFEKFITSNPLIFPLRAGLRVQIDKFSFSDKVRIRPHGTSVSVWTVREAIRSELPTDGS